MAEACVDFAFESVTQARCLCAQLHIQAAVAIQARTGGSRVDGSRDNDCADARAARETKLTRPRSTRSILTPMRNHTNVRNKVLACNGPIALTAPTCGEPINVARTLFASDAIWKRCCSIPHARYKSCKRPAPTPPCVPTPHRAPAPHRASRSHCLADSQQVGLTVCSAGAIAVAT